MRANEGVEGVNRNVEGANGGAPDFSTIIAQQLQNLLPDMLAQVSNRGNVGNQIEFCPSLEMQKLESELWNRVMVGADHATYTDRFYELARLIRGMVAATEPKVVLISSVQTDEAVRNGSIKKVEKRENVGKPSKDKNGRDDNKRTKTGNAFATTANPIMPPRMRTRSAGRLAAESLGGGTGVRVGRGGRGRRPREGNDERVNDLNGQGNVQVMRANGGVDGVNGNVEEANGGAPDFSTIIS
nr:reverse transcriptase domain-containing protein [Tanacetum cinerariifolium]